MPSECRARRPSKYFAHHNLAFPRGGPTLRAMAKTYRPYVPEQDLLLPPSLRDWLSDDHLAYFVSDLVDQLDLSAITLVYGDDERGSRRITR